MTRRRDFGSIQADGDKFTIRWFEAGKKRRKRGFDTRKEAASRLAKIRAELDSGAREVGAPIAFDVTVEDAIGAYLRYLRDEKGNKPGPTEDTEYRLRTFFGEPSAPLADLTQDCCRRLYAALRSRISPRTGKPFAVDSHRNILAEARSLLKWCRDSKRWLRTNPLDGVEGVGKRKHGKPQLRIDEARRWLAVAQAHATAGDAGAVAAMVALLLGMRATEIISRVVRDLDDGGNQIWIPSSKTENGRRTLRVPVELRDHLLNLAANKGPDDLLFGDHWRDWVRKNVRRICTEAKVPHVSAHSMRGLHATLAMEAGVTGAVVAASLGQGSASVTVQSYADAAAVAAGKQRTTLRVLAGGVG